MEKAVLTKRVLKHNKWTIFEFTYPDGKKGTPFADKQSALIWAKEKGWEVVDNTEGDQ